LPLLHSLVCAAALAFAPCHVSAERAHKVAGGQTMAGIAKRYGVTVWSLAAANRLKPDSQVQVGQVLSVPEDGAVYVNEGQTLWSVARRHRCSVDALARANGLNASSSLRPGMRLMLPGHNAKSSASSGPSGKKWGTPKRAGRVSLVRVATKETVSLNISDAKGRVRKHASSELARFLKPRNSKRTKTPPRRLVQLLGQISDHFGGRTLHVVSGYRLAGGYTNHESRHVAGAAIDFRVEGVPNTVLRDYLRHFDDVGVGFYPHSTFIHFDVREKNAYWVDMSGPGQKPHYLGRAERDGLSDAERHVTNTPIEQIVGAALEEAAHGEPEEALADDE
jgi:uncharacterized protein YcbK (DUF882 family)